MDSFELNKLLGGLLGAVFVVFSIGILSDAIFASPAPEKPGFIVEAPEEDAAGGGPEAPTVEPIAVRLATADPDAGETVFKKCAACHTGDKGGANKVGPNLFDLVNRPIASHEGFSYSGAMKEFSEGGSVVWDYDHLDHFLENPRGYVKGTAMSFAGVKKPDERANLIAYLHTLSDNPAPLPEPPAEEESAASGGDQPAAEGGEAPKEEAAPAGDEPAAEENAEQPAAEDDAAPAAQEPAAQEDGNQPAAEDDGATAEPAPTEEKPAAQ